MFTDAWFYPPLGVARVGRGVPLDAFFFGPNDTRPQGSGRTTILPAPSLSVLPDGSTRTYYPSKIDFKWGGFLRPVCPFFELHGTLYGREVPITVQRLKRLNLTLADLCWKVSVANLKPFWRTQKQSDRIEAAVEIKGDNHTVYELRGQSPLMDRTLLMPGEWIPLGRVQVLRPRHGREVLRMRFYPPAGEIYGPRNLPVRTKLRLPAGHLRLNPQAYWCQWHPDSAVSPRESPPGGYLTEDGSDISLGLVDDFSDGLIECELGAHGPVAKARIAVGPPDFAPDRRHIVSVADGLKDRVDRISVHDPAYYQVKSSTDPLFTLADEEIRDLFERVLETAGTMNLEAIIDRVDKVENAFQAYKNDVPLAVGEHFGFGPRVPTKAQPFPLTEVARERHRRMAVLQVLMRLFRQSPHMVERMIRPPGSPIPLFDRRMPTLTRGSDIGPLALTRRQYEFLSAWVSRL